MGLVLMPSPAIVMADCVKHYFRAQTETVSHISPSPSIPICKGKFQIMASSRSLFLTSFLKLALLALLVLGKPARDCKTSQLKRNLKKKNQSNNITGISKQFRLKSIIWGKCLKSLLLSSLRIFMQN